MRAYMSSKGMYSRLQKGFDCSSWTVHIVCNVYNSTTEISAFRHLLFWWIVVTSAVHYRTVLSFYDGHPCFLNFNTFPADIVIAI